MKQKNGTKALLTPVHACTLPVYALGNVRVCLELTDKEAAGRFDTAPGDGGPATIYLGIRGAEIDVYAVLLHEIQELLMCQLGLAHQAEKHLYLLGPVPPGVRQFAMTHDEYMTLCEQAARFLFRAWPVVRARWLKCCKELS